MEDTSRGLTPLEEGPSLRLQLLGGCSLEGGRLGHGKPMALLALLAATPGGLGREAVAGMLWPESASSAARGALRQALHYLRRHLPACGAQEVILADRRHLRLNPEYPLDTDIDRFLAAVRAESEVSDDRLRQGVAAYGGPFLAGFHVGGDTSFEEWAAEQRAWLRDQARLLFFRLALRYSEGGHTDAAMELASRYVGLEPEDAEGRRQLSAFLDRVPLREDRGPQAIATSQYRPVTAVYCEPPLPHEGPEETRLYSAASARCRCQEVLEQHGGRSEMAPDGAVVGYFGLPPVVEGGLEQACRAVQALVERFGGPSQDGDGLRIGLHRDWSLGSDSGHPDYMAGVVRQARTAAMAAPAGAVRATGAVAAALPATWGAVEAGERAAGGPLYVPYPGQTVASGTEWPFVGRRSELAGLLWYARALDRGRGGSLEVTGEAGVGKTRLLEEWRRRLPEHFRVLRAQASEMTSITPLAPITDLLSRMAGADGGRTAAERRSRLDAFLAACPGLALQARQDILRLFAEDPDPADAGDPVPALVSLFRGLARTPTVFVFEELHWADETSRSLTRRLTSLAEDASLLVVAAARPEGALEEEGVRRLPLEPLTPDQSETLVARLGRRHGLPPSLNEAVARRSEGVPLFAEELVREWSGGGRTDDPGGVVGLGDLCNARLQAVGPAKRTAQLVALLGRETGLDLLAQVAERDPQEVALDLRALEAADLVRRHHTTQGSRFRIKHALLEEGIYATLPAGERAMLHGRAARILETELAGQAAARPEWLAWHREQAGDYLGAARLQLEAVRRAAHLGGHDQVLEHLSAARRLLGAAPDCEARDCLESEVGRFYVTQSFFLHGFRQTREDLVSGGGHEGGVDFESLFTELLRGLADQPWSRQLGRAEKLLEQAEADGERDKILTARHLVGFVAYYAGELTLADRHFGDVLPEGLEEAPDWLVRLYNGPPKPVESVYRAAVALRRGRSAEARRLERAARRQARRHGAATLLTYVLVLGAALYRYAREPRKTLALAREAADLSRQEGIRGIRIFGIANREWAKAALGRRASVGRIHALALSETRHDKGGNPGRFMLAALVAPAYGLQGRFREQLPLLRQLLSGEPELWAPELTHDELHTLLGEALLAEGRPGEGEEVLRRALRIARAADNRRQQLRVAMALGQFCERRGRAAEAAALLARAVAEQPPGEANPDLAAAQALAQRCRPGAEKAG